MAETEPTPIVTQGLDPKSGSSHSETESSPVHGAWGSKDGNISNAEWNDAEELEKKGEIPDRPKQARKKVVVVGLGMVGIAFM